MLNCVHLSPNGHLTPLSVNGDGSCSILARRFRPICTAPSSVDPDLTSSGELTWPETAAARAQGPLQERTQRWHTSRGLRSVLFLVLLYRHVLLSVCMPAPVMESSSSRPPHPPLVRSYSFGGRATGAKPGLLRRAQNLLSVPLPTMNELHEDALVAEDTSGSGTRTRPSAERRKSDGSFGQSFKKYVDNVVARAPSLKKRHSLTHSDSEASRPISLKRATSAALKRRSQPPPTPQQLPAPGQFPAPHDPAMPDTFEVPTVIREGTQMTKVSSKHIKTNVYRIDPHRGLILWPSRKAGMSASHLVSVTR